MLTAEVEPDELFDDVVEVPDEVVGAEDELAVEDGLDELAVVDTEAGVLVVLVVPDELVSAAIAVPVERKMAAAKAAPHRRMARVRSRRA